MKNLSLSTVLKSLVAFFIASLILLVIIDVLTNGAKML